MTQARGANSQLVIDFETTFGADPASPAGLLMPVNSSSLNGVLAKNRAATISSSRNPVQPFAGNKSASGSIVVPVDSLAMWYWCKAMFGDPVTSGSTSPYTHVFTVDDTQPSLVIEQGYTDITEYDKYNGCKVSSFAITVGGDGELTAELGIVGASFAGLSATPYDASPTAVTIARLNNFQAALTEGGSAFSSATEVSINIDFGLDTSNYVIGGGGELGDIPEGVIGVSGTLTALFESSALLDKALASTESSLEITIGSSSSIFKIEIPELEYSYKSPGIPGPQGIRQSLDFQGFYANDADASAVIMTIVNTEAHA